MASNGRPKFKVVAVTVYQIQDNDRYYYKGDDIAEVVQNVFSNESKAHKQCELLNEVFDNGSRHGVDSYKRDEREKQANAKVNSAYANE
jgi:hypothetical protein